MDSNGKFIEPKKLFPGKQVKVTRCSNTARALELLKRDTLGSPNYVIVHTGTNDLHRLRQNTAHAVRRMAEKASREFPDSRVVISTLLPRTDVPPHVIRDINAEIARSCAALPNVHLAHHPTIGPWYLYDGLHLDQDDIPTLRQDIRHRLGIRLVILIHIFNLAVPLTINGKRLYRALSATLLILTELNTFQCFGASIFRPTLHRRFSRGGGCAQNRCLLYRFGLLCLRFYYALLRGACSLRCLSHLSQFTILSTSFRLRDRGAVFSTARSLPSMRASETLVSHVTTFKTLSIS
ncbi:hypothetical protein SKAU_G00148580 [Synaphobranchus kaupii]|uniref:SGNH hydrolase-type esterase domain-containing protein n=1 Tax=Synaphobranchus kaupii TaxID=118154 RepID=A0A9Q1FUN8_SYNKA|nr:hypothetical protein SKAU_G00148580 [Synaphobranchus kaupii]